MTTRIGLGVTGSFLNACHFLQVHSLSLGRLEFGKWSQPDF